MNSLISSGLKVRPQAFTTPSTASAGSAVPTAALLAGLLVIAVFVATAVLATGLLGRIVGTRA